MSQAVYLPADRLDPADSDYAAKSEALSFVRIKELTLSPLPGDFDARHLKAIHGHLFQDSPDRHAPGQYRPESAHHVKFRKLEGPTGEYLVRHATTSTRTRRACTSDVLARHSQDCVRQLFECRAPGWGRSSRCGCARSLPVAIQYQPFTSSSIRTALKTPLSLHTLAPPLCAP